MLGVAIFLVLLFAMFGFFAWVAWKDPAGIFKPRPRPPGRDDEPPAG